MRSGTEQAPVRLTVEAAARAAGVSRQSVYRWIWHGRLEAVPTDGGYLVDAGELERFLAARRAAGAAGLRVDMLLQWADGAAGGA